MKRNKALARASRNGISPYVKYEKRPHRYSPKYYDWLSGFRKKEEKALGRL